MSYVLDVMLIGLSDTVAFGPHYHSLLAMAIRVIVTVPMTFLGNCFLEVVHGFCGANCSHTHTAILCEFKELAVGQLSGVKLRNWLWDSFLV